MKKNLIPILVCLIVLSIIPITAQNQIIDISSNDASIKREISKDKLMLEKKRYIDAEQKYETALNKVELSKNMLIHDKDEFDACLDDYSKKSECTVIINEYKNNSIQLLTNTLLVLENGINMIKSKIASNENMDEQTAIQIIAELDESLKIIETEKEKVNALSEESSYETIKAMRDEIKTLVSVTKGVMKESVAKLVLAKMSGILVMSEKLSGKLQGKLEELEALGNDIYVATDKKKEFDSKIENVKNLLTEASKLLVTNEKQQLNEAHENLILAYQELKDAHIILKELIQEIKPKSDIRKVKQ